MELTIVAPVALIFDMDGVLIDNHAFHLQAWIEFCKRYGIEITPEEFDQNMFGGSNRDLLERVFNKKLEDRQIYILANEKEIIYRELHAPYIKPIAGVIEFILSVRDQHIKTALATAAPRSNLDFMLEHTHIRALFDVMIDDTQVTRGKPDPEIYLKTARLLGFPPEKCIVFEDSLTGIKAAQSAGMKVIGVATSLPKESLIHTWKVINNFTEIKLNDLFI